MIWSAFVIGLLGSLHCVGMCGPLALAVPAKPGYRFLSASIYNVGRIVTYGFLGIVFGLFGFGLQLAGFQSYLSIFAGLFIAGWVAYTPFSRWITKNTRINFDSQIRKQITSRLIKPTFPSIFLIGTFNGLLPCGLIYMALVGAMETGYVELAAIFMMLFGIGTALPLLLAMVSKDFFSRFKLLRHRYVIPIFSLVLATMFMARGVIYLLPPEQQQTPLVEKLAAITFCNLNAH